ncbi:MAG: VCBS repeat-containing protein, partial [Lentisphaeria bacterium]|nr:VCBS repeat-containing protein [Lentisphaeria bacterium]
FTYLKGLGKEWTVAAIGDLNGDGLDDVVLRHDAGFTGAYMIDENGKITWSSLDTLKSDMTIVGTGDFNGDGVDDVLLQNKSNGWVGAWLVEDGRVDSFIGLCNNKNTIEQIADYNADGIDDLRIRTEKGDIGVLYVNGADDTTWKYFQSVGKEWDTSFSALA